MSEYGVGPGTVQRALAALTREGLTRTKPGDGTFVAERPRRAAEPDFGWQAVALGERSFSVEPLAELVTTPPAGALVLSTGYLAPDLQPTAQLGPALARAGRRPGVWERPPVEGVEALRRWFADDVGNGFDPHEVLIVSGGQAALVASFRALARPGEAVLMESPTYLGAMVAARAAGLRPVPVPSDAHGVRPELLSAAFESSGARLFYCQPLYANPHGAVLAADRRGEVLTAAADAAAFVIEDDYARDLGLDGEAPPPLVADDRDGHVIYVRSLTKPTTPSLRVAAVAARGAAYARLRAIRLVDDFFVSSPLQEAALELVSSPAWPRHLRAVRKALRERRDVLVDAARDGFGATSIPHLPGGGFHLWVRLPPECDDRLIADRAYSAGLVVTPGRHWFPAEPPGPFLRLSYAGAPAAALRSGVARLAEIIAAHTAKV